ncbi:MAG: response regulator [Anaerolineae bacterium]|nr:response regulator [Anaerolineae bacterium]
MPHARILVIEDNPDNLQLVRFLLEQAGHQVMGAMDGRMGGELTRAVHPDLVLIDLTIPGIDGWTLARQLKDDPTTAHIPLLALTAHTLPGDRKKALDAGCDGYISKPLDIGAFVATVEAHLGK